MENAIRHYAIIFVNPYIENNRVGGNSSDWSVK